MITPTKNALFMNFVQASFLYYFYTWDRRHKSIWIFSPHRPPAAVVENSNPAISGKAAPLPVSKDEEGVPPKYQPVELVSVIGVLMMMSLYDTPAHASQRATVISKNKMCVFAIRLVKYPGRSLPDVTDCSLLVKKSIPCQFFRLEPTLPTSFFPEQIINKTPLKIFFLPTEGKVIFPEHVEHAQRLLIPYALR
jgi:hypothetical protein